jgi:hypothetical protein
METPQEFAEGQVRRFMTVLFVARAKRHLKSLGELYGWTPGQLAEYEARFIKPAEFIPQFVTHSLVVDS